MRKPDRPPSLPLAALFAAGLLSGVLQAAAANAPLSDEEFFQKLDLERSALENVRSAVQGGDLALARAGLAAYYRTRSGVYHYVDGQDPARHVTDPGGRLRGARSLVERTGAWDAQYWDGNFFDWQAAPVNRKERMYFFEGLGEAAAVEEGDEVAGALVNLIRSFVHTYHSPASRGSGMWATMNAGIRMRTGWPVAFLCLLQSPAFTDDDIILFLKSVWDQSDYLRRHPSQTSNWLTFEMAGLYTSGAVFPEFRDAVEWRRFASETAVEDIGRGWLPDGMTIELSPEYGRFFSNFFVIHDLAQHVGRLDEFNLAAFPPQTEPLYESYLKIMAPNRLAPATNDNTPANVVAILNEGLQRFPYREDFRWVVTEGREGNPPDFTSKILPYAGFAAMRSGWERDASMLYFGFGPVGYRHAHQDGLNVMLWAYGRQVLFDPGLSNYDYDQPMVNYAVDTFSHNTVLVDGRPQRRPWYNNPHPNRMPYQPLTDFRWRTTPEQDVAAGLYDQAYGMQGVSNAYPYSPGSNFRQGWVHPSTHHRRIFFLKPDVFVVADTLVSKDGQSHHYDLRWHLDTANRSLGADGHTITTEDANQPNLQVVPLLPEELQVQATSGQMSPEILGWNAGNPLNPRPATTVQHLKSGDGTVQFLTLLLPLRPGQAPLLESLAPIDDSTIEVHLTDGRRLLVHAPPDPRADLSVIPVAEKAGPLEDDFESYEPGTQPTRPTDRNPYLWAFSFGGGSQNREVSVVETHAADGSPTQAMRLHQGKPLADSRDGLSFSRRFAPPESDEVELCFRFRLNANLYSSSPQELGGTYYQLRLGDTSGQTAVRLQVTLDGADGLRDRVTPDNPKPGFTVQQGPDRNTDRRNIVPSIRPGDWYEIRIRASLATQSFSISIRNLNTDEPGHSGAAEDLPFLESVSNLSEISGGRSWTWSILDAHVDDVSVQPVPPRIGMEAWIHRHFTLEERLDPGIAGLQAAPAGDGVANLLKYALGLSPWQPAGARLPRALIESVDGEDYLSLVVVRPPSIADVTFDVVASDDLAVSPAPAMLVRVVEQDDGASAFTYRDTMPVRTSDRRFLRLRVETR